MSSRRRLHKACKTRVYGDTQRGLEGPRNGPQAHSPGYEFHFYFGWTEQLRWLERLDWHKSEYGETKQRWGQAEAANEEASQQVGFGER